MVKTNNNGYYLSKFISNKIKLRHGKNMPQLYERTLNKHFYYLILITDKAIISGHCIPTKHTYANDCQTARPWRHNNGSQNLSKV